ncbi:alpha-L-rhamnosidase [Bacteroides eggerthii]|uniref:Alpha-L-rhamnosidase n=1 Tax=Bacteroides eggerthii TaxID=28111 RepID=A0A975Q6E1_9BACE|nr:glycosyl hydrolase [Bacteroides eggerthii]QUT45336.1 alpha-L-rhamnosidase [Bacteroides eggerthii]
MKIKYLLVLIVLLSITFVGCGTRQNMPTEEQSVRYTADDARPWTFWYWMYGAVTPEGITADLEAMKQVGLGGAYLMPIKGVGQGAEYEGQAQQLTPEFWEMVDHSMKEAKRLGLRLGMHICDGFALAGGPWIAPQESMQKIVWSDTIIRGGNIERLPLPQLESYEGYSEDIATYAIPLGKQPADVVMRPVISLATLPGTEVKDKKKAVNMDEKGVIRSSYPCRIDYTYEQPVTVSNVEIVLSGNNYQAHRLKVLVSDDGRNYRFLKQLKPARHGWQNTDCHSTHGLPPTTAKYFRFEWTPEGSEPGCEDLDAAKWKPNLKIKEIRLHTAPRIHQWEGKAGFVWRVADASTSQEIPDEACVQLNEVRRLTLTDGALTAKLPEGEWRILRMGHTSTGHVNATAGGGKGLECDKFSVAAVRKQFDNWFAQVFEKTTPEVAREVLKYMHVDSWECGSQNWSATFAAEFKSRRGYDLMPYLPLLAGIPMESAEKSEQVLRDVRITIGELVTDVFYTVLAQCAGEYDCRFSAECVSPTMVADGLCHYDKVDLPMGEFWLNSPTHDKLNDVLDAVSGAHIYGKNVIQAEGFTEIRGTWDEDPAMLKPLLDRNYALGINKLFFHVFTHNPWLDRAPGMTLDGIGLFYQRDQTWFRESSAFVDYATRCQTLLQKGTPVVDIAVFTGEEMPRRAILPDRLVSMLPGIYGAERVESERVRLANEGQPLRVVPVGVTHSANMADPDKWINPLRGYQYDSFNKDALLRLAKVEDGHIVLPGGGRYKVLVLPTARPMDPTAVPLSKEVEQKIAEWKEQGVIIPELPYKAESFAVMGLERDVELPAEVAYTHRTADDMEIYFIANQKNEARNFTVSFRQKGLAPKLYDAVTGRTYIPEQWAEREGRTEVSLSLPAYGSHFVIFFKSKDALELFAGDSLLHEENVAAENMAKRLVRHEWKEESRTPLENSEWTVHFEKTDVKLVRDELFDWSKESDAKVKFYSGRACYTSSFVVQDEFDGSVLLSLGRVANVATVRVNGKACGIAWTPPYQIDITSALVAGANRLEIEVVNTWANALRGMDQGSAPFDGIWANAKYRLPGDDLLPAGLLGPVELVRMK